ncbi:lipopolysaccharide biosynthesis protein [Salinisphaera sp. SPP-AMP-43]|uniref:lipopolysaccharide biosynthesis protein n=1 Tax=Salinisphaera sp. SPP-AMP-43 TaxID=3121288 RepID=UPI003C6E5B32
MGRIRFFKAAKPDVKTQNRKSLRLSLFFSTAQQYTALLITIPSMMILSRLLTPAQIGVYSVAIAFVNLVHMLRDLGTSEYLVQSASLEDDIARSAFTVTLIMAWALAVVLFVASPWVALFFDEKGLGAVLRILCLTYLLLPIGSTVNAMLIREMEFGLRYKINTAQVLVQNLVTISLAWFGWGYFSPAWGAVAGMLATISGCFYWAGHYRIRGLSLAHWRPITKFGLNQTAGSVMQRLGESAPDFVIGRVLGFAQVGLYSRGFGLVRMFRDNISGAVGSVTFSAFSHRHRNGGGANELYLRSITFITGLGWPFLGFASFMAFPIIRIFFGDQWDEAVPILRLLAIQGMLSLIVIHFQELLTGTGRVGLATALTGAWQGTLVAALLLAAPFGLVAVASSLIPATVITVIIVMVCLAYTVQIQLSSFMSALWPSTVLSFCALVPVAISRYVYPPGVDALWGPLITAGLGLIAGSVVGGWLSSHPLWHEIKGFLIKRLTGCSATPNES